MGDVNKNGDNTASNAALEEIGDAIVRALGKAGVADVLGIVCGALVGLTTEIARRNGEDPEKTITLDGGDSRKITIHAKTEL